MSKTLIERQIDFINRANEIHNHFYDYSKSKYITAKTIIEIICPLHGSFNILPTNHISLKRGCSECKKENKQPNVTNLKEFIRQANMIHNNQYDYSKTIYENTFKPVTIICQIHGEFLQRPTNHIQGLGCSECGNLKRTNKKLSSTENFIQKSKALWGNIYDYTNSDYIHSDKELIVLCKKHGEFKVTPHNHLRLVGCFQCTKENNMSKGERIIYEFLLNNNIKFQQEYKFTDCINPKTNTLLRFDFYLLDYDILIEYDGEYHYRERKDRIDSLKEQQIRDSIKTKYCIDNNIRLIRISYLDNINQVLSSTLKYDNDP